jgi:hypothetical protein
MASGFLPEDDGLNLTGRDTQPASPTFVWVYIVRDSLFTSDGFKGTGLFASPAIDTGFRINPGVFSLRDEGTNSLLRTDINTDTTGPAFNGINHSNIVDNSDGVERAGLLTASASDTSHITEIFNGLSHVL